MGASDGNAGAEPGGGLREMLAFLPLSAQNGFRLQYTNYTLANASAGVSSTPSLTELRGADLREAEVYYPFGPFPWFGGEMLFYLQSSPEFRVLYEGLERSIGASWDGGLLLHLGLGTFDPAEVAEMLLKLEYNERAVGEAVHLSVTGFQPGTLVDEGQPPYGLDLRDVVAGDGFLLFVRQAFGDLAGFTAGASLAEHPALAAFARELDRLPVFGAYLEDTRESGFTLRGTPGDEPGPVQPLPRYEALAVATGEDGDGFFALALLWFTSDAEAIESVRLIQSNFEVARGIGLGTPFEEHFDLVEVSANGRLAQVLLRPVGNLSDDPGLFAKMATSRDLAFIASR